MDGGDPSCIRKTSHTDIPGRRVLLQMKRGVGLVLIKVVNKFVNLNFALHKAHCSYAKNSTNCFSQFEYFGRNFGGKLASAP